MALSNLEGSTIGGLDEGRGHNARILAFNGTVSNLDVDQTSVHTVDTDGTVTDSASAGSAALTVGYGHGITLEMPDLTNDGEDTLANVVKLTFGVVGSHTAGVLDANDDTAPGNSNSSIGSTEQINIQVATVNAVLVDNETTDVEVPLPAAVTSISGNQISIRLGEAQTAGTEVVIGNTDSIKFNVIALAIPA